MPVMTGYESTRHIRMIETERRLAYEHQNLIQSPYISTTLPPSSFPFNLPSPSSISPSSIFPTSPTSPSAFDPATMNRRMQLPRLRLNSPALIIALTGFSSQKDQEMAFEAGVDIFMTKPVRFREVGRILEGWMRSREEAVAGAGTGGGGTGGNGFAGIAEGIRMEKEGKARDEKRDIDEMERGAKRSG